MLNTCIFLSPPVSTYLYHYLTMSVCATGSAQVLRLYLYLLLFSVSPTELSSMLFFYLFINHVPNPPPLFIVSFIVLSSSLALILYLFVFLSNCVCLSEQFLLPSFPSPALSSSLSLSIYLPLPFLFLSLFCLIPPSPPDHFLFMIHILLPTVSLPPPPPHVLTSSSNPLFPLQAAVDVVPAQLMSDL